MLKCKFDYNGGIETRCFLEIHRNNDNAVIWTGHDNHNLSNQVDNCVFYPLQLTPRVNYKFIVTTLNTLGNANSYVLYSSISDTTMSHQQTILANNDTDEEQLSLLTKRNAININ